MPTTCAVLLAGGLGTRLRPLTYAVPKPLAPVANRPLISYSLRMLRRGGVEEAILASGHMADRLREALAGEREDGLLVRCVDEPELLDTAGGVKNALPWADASFIAMNGDQIMDVDVRALLDSHERNRADLTIVVRRVDDVSAFGLVRCDEELRIEAFLEKRPDDPTGRNLVNSGLYVFSPSVLDAIPAGRPYSNERELFPGLVEAGARVFAFPMLSEAYWADVGTPVKYLDANRRILGGALPWADPPSDPERTSDIAPGAHVAPTAQIGPGVAVGAGAEVGEGAAVANSLLWPGAIVEAGCRLASAIVGPGCRVPAGTVISCEGAAIVANAVTETPDA
ncbi:MAG: NDP-sugar synthase [Armatimonadetes bacterium]|nr:NDP-sugar synthase [Armatimonadota bacterium]